MSIALIVYFLLGWNIDENIIAHNGELTNHLVNTFNISAWLLLAPVITCTLIVLRVNVLITLTISSLLGIVGLITFESQLIPILANGNNNIIAIINTMLFPSSKNVTRFRYKDSLTPEDITSALLSTIPVLCKTLFIASAITFSSVNNVANTHFIPHIPAYPKKKESPFLSMIIKLSINVGF